MKKIVLAACLALSFAMPSAYSQSSVPADPDSVAAVRDLLDAQHYRDTMQQMVAQMQKAMPAMHLQSAIASINANPALTDEQKSLDIAKAKIDAEQSGIAIAATFNQSLMDELVAEIVPVYARHFTAAELRQMAAYYRTPVGAKMVQMMPQIAGEMMQITQKIMMPHLKAAMDKAAKPQ